MVACFAFITELCVLFAAIRNPSLASTTGALRAISNAALDPVFDKLHEALLVTILFVLDDPKARVFTRPGAEIRVRQKNSL